MSNTVFLELLALAQCMPGPSSTQLSFAIGIIKKGIPGGLLSGKRVCFTNGIHRNERVEKINL